MQVTDRNADETPQLLLDDPYSPWHLSDSKWRSEPIVHVRGYAWVDGASLENESLAAHFRLLAVQGRDAVRAEIPRLNGGWAVVVVWPDGHVLAAADRLRTVPLFFHLNHRTVAIADSAATLAERFSRPMRGRPQLEFLLFGYVPGAETLYDGVQQLRPGEIVEFRAGRLVDSHRYYRLYPPAEASESARIANGGDYVDQLADVLRGTFERFRDGYRGERVAIPLSGGLDSRLVAGMLRRLGIDNCLCYTYGNESQEEVRLSRQVAEALGFEWRCLSNSGEVFGRLGIAAAYDTYMPYGSKGVSAPHAQDFAAVMQLAAEGVGGPQAIYFPGHSADMNAGSHIPPDYPDLFAGTLSVTDEIVRHHASPTWHEPGKMLTAPERGEILSALQVEAKPLNGVDRVNPLACCEMWNAENRQAKYIINSVRIYEFARARWRTLWDYEFMDFYLRVPLKLRYGQRLYLDCLRERVFVGDLAALADIPVTGHGPLSAITTLRRPSRRTSRFDRYRGALRRKLAWRRFKAGSRHPKGVTNSKNEAVVLLDGFAEVDPRRTFLEALEHVGASDRLTPDIRQALTPWLSMRLESVPLMAIHTVLTLARMTR
jgi:asparagine synthase (glutamine-hydrolysing)